MWHCCASNIYLLILLFVLKSTVSVLSGVFKKNKINKKIMCLDTRLHNYLRYRADVV